MEPLSESALACYCRVSFQHQRNDGQKAEIMRWLSAQGIDPGAVLWFEDQETAKTLNRPAFQALQHAVFEGRVRTVVVWKLDQLSHNQ